jgi:hypothetical protein
MDYVLLVTLFFVGQAVAYWVGRRDERRTIKDFCDSIGLSDLMFQLTEDYMAATREDCDCPECEKERAEKSEK